MFLGKLNEAYDDYSDISNRELFTIIPIAILVLLFGVYPAPLVNLVGPAMSGIIDIIQSAL